MFAIYPTSCPKPNPERSLRHPTDSNFVLGNAQAKDRPIVYCSDGFCELTGFARAQVMSKPCACRFLWGQATEPTERQKIEDSLLAQRELQTEVVFYKKTGSQFVCLLDIVPIKNEKGDVVLFLASHKDITKQKKDFPRRRSRAVLYHLSGQFDSRNKSKPFSQLNKIHSLGGGSAMPEYKVQEVKKSRCILLHYGLLKISWDWLILLFTFYIAIMVPYNAANSNGRARKAGTAAIEDAGVVIDLLVEVVFIAGKLKLYICINFRTTFVSKGGQVVYCQRLIAINYTKTWFFLDLLAAVPFDMIIIISKAEAFNLMKLARMLRLVKLYQKIDRYAQYSSLVLLLLISMFALSAHWFACIWLVIGRKQLELNQTREISWMSKLSDDMKAPFNFQCSSVDEDRSGNASSGCSEGGPTKSSRYITALYYTCSSLTSIGFGNVSANTDHEKIFSICIMLIGALMHAAVFGNVTALIQKMYARRAAYTAKTQELKDFTRTHHIPKHLKRRMQEFFQAMWSINRGINPNEIMKDFPDELRGDIALHLNREILSLPIFESASQGCLKAIAQQILTVFCRPEEYIVHSGDVLKYIYFVVNGSMEILKDNMVVAILGKGDLFGTDIKNPEGLMRSMCDVRSLTYCDLQCVELRGLIQLLQQYPEYHEKFKDDLLQDLAYNMREGSDIEEEEEFQRQHGTVMPAVTLPIIGEEKEEDEEDEEEGGNAAGEAADSKTAVDGSEEKLLGACGNSGLAAL
uniref:Potassium voltage-gated channel subfamily H member 2 n=1 Tax=Macrostomum lignano TaxID=282301 RepID=A0A1I8GSH9_9PLAT